MVSAQFLTLFEAKKIPAYPSHASLLSPFLVGCGARRILNTNRTPPANMKRYLVILSVASLQWLLAPFGAAHFERLFLFVREDSLQSSARLRLDARSSKFRTWAKIVEQVSSLFPYSLLTQARCLCYLFRYPLISPLKITLLLPKPHCICER